MIERRFEIIKNDNARYDQEKKQLLSDKASIVEKLHEKEKKWKQTEQMLIENQRTYHKLHESVKLRLKAHEEELARTEKGKEIIERKMREREAKYLKELQDKNIELSQTKKNFNKHIAQLKKKDAKKSKVRLSNQGKQLKEALAKISKFEEQTHRLQLEVESLRQKSDQQNFSTSVFEDNSELVDRHIIEQSPPQYKVSVHEIQPLSLQLTETFSMRESRTIGSSSDEKELENDLRVVVEQKDNQIQVLKAQMKNKADSFETERERFKETKRQALQDLQKQTQFIKIESERLQQTINDFQHEFGLVPQLQQPLMKKKNLYDDDNQMLKIEDTFKTQLNFQTKEEVHKSMIYCFQLVTTEVKELQQTMIKLHTEINILVEEQQRQISEKQEEKQNSGVDNTNIYSKSENSRLIPPIDSNEGKVIQTPRSRVEISVNEQSGKNAKLIATAVISGVTVGFFVGIFSYFHWKKKIKSEAQKFQALLDAHQSSIINHQLTANRQPNDQESLYTLIRQWFFR